MEATKTKGGVPVDDIKIIFASNLIRLRTAAGMTQLDLGEALNYSDKAVSKWERAESMPDVAALVQIARLFHVTLDELVSPQETWKLPVTEKEALDEKKRFSWFIILLSLLGIVVAAGLVFIILWIAADLVEWRVFIFMLPLLFTTWVTLNSCLLEGKGNRYIVMGLVTSLLTVVYFAMIRVSNAWQLFLLVPPVNLLVWLSFVVSRAHRRRTSTQSREEESTGRED